jgi:hypothetical protein
MENTKFKDVLKSYESKVEDVEYNSISKKDEEKRIISNDVKRTTFLSLNKNEKVKTKYLKLVLYDLLSEIPNPYVQGMSEIASVLVYYYLSEDFDKFCVKIQDENGDTDDSSMELNLEDEKNESYKEFNKFIKKKKEKVRVVLTNVFTRKFDPLVCNDFRLYKEYSGVFIEMMRKRGFNIKNTEVHKYMGSIFTFFCRDVTSMEDAYRIFEIILSTPPTSFFLLIIIYYDIISKKKLIDSVDCNLYKSVILLEDEFVKTSEKLKNGKGCFFSRNAVLVGGIVGFVVAVALYKINKKPND